MFQAQHKAVEVRGALGDLVSFNLVVLLVLSTELLVHLTDRLRSTLDLGDRGLIFKGVLGNRFIESILVFLSWLLAHPGILVASLSRFLCRVLTHQLF